MTVFYDFTQNTQAPFQFQPTFDGQVYNVILTWNLFGQRYYFNIFDLSGNFVVALPVIASPVALNVQDIEWGSPHSGSVKITTINPHGRKIGNVALLTVSGMSPDAYNGTYLMNVSGPNTLIYNLAQNPGQATALGTVGHNINLLAGYFTTTMIFRDGTSQFEVN
jgi:hypothetical protein